MFDLTLTFDNGPEPGVTPRVLDVLRECGIKTTFFVIGEKLAQAQNRVHAERAHAEGHWIGNHTWSHSLPFGLMQADAAIAEFDRTQQAIGALLHPCRFFRPYGQGGNLDQRLLSRALLDYMARVRATIVLWSALPRDWEDAEGWVERALVQCAASPWSLMVLHDLPTGAMRHLDRFLAEARRRGCRFRQDFPPASVVITAGRVTGPLADFVGS